MGMGLGHQYWVRLVEHCYGSLEQCLEFMNTVSYNPSSQWFELKCDVKVVKCTASPGLGFYTCDLVESVK